MFKADLHLHTTFSDGMLEPVELIKLIKKAEISYISITDHDNMNNLPEISSACSKYKIKYIPGVEISCDFEGREIHILAYFGEIINSSLFTLLSKIQEMRLERLKKIISLLNKNKISVKLEDVLEIGKNSVALGRPHIAKVLFKKGFVNTFQGAFNKYLGTGCIAFVKKTNPDFNEVIDIIRNSNGISFLAHPGSDFNDDEIKKIINNGIDGIEIYHPSHSYTEVIKYLNLAKINNLLITGGSDFHGYTDAEVKNIGKYYIENYYLQQINLKLNNIRENVNSK